MEKPMVYFGGMIYIQPSAKVSLLFPDFRKEKSGNGKPALGGPKSSGISARATSAAPPYFKPYKGYHDGVLGAHNNPVNLALREQDLIWDRKGKQPDFVLSLGTGSAIESDSGDTEGSTNTSWIS
ncbi:hypothetical protein VF21_05669 [Pseudogymnoascus sp. 05NY08]|nr:hypothetical protein VF21_05669 [Pseudogymnoascus sp. 05NY08]